MHYFGMDIISYQISLKYCMIYFHVMLATLVYYGEIILHIALNLPRVKTNAEKKNIINLIPKFFICLQKQTIQFIFLSKILQKCYVREITKKDRFLLGTSFNILRTAYYSSMLKIQLKNRFYLVYIVVNSELQLKYITKPSYIGFVLCVQCNESSAIDNENLISQCL